MIYAIRDWYSREDIFQLFDGFKYKFEGNEIETDAVEIADNHLINFISKFERVEIFPADEKCLYWRITVKLKNNY